MIGQIVQLSQVPHSNFTTYSKVPIKLVTIKQPAAQKTLADPDKQKIANDFEEPCLKLIITALILVVIGALSISVYNTTLARASQSQVQQAPSQVNLVSHAVEQVAVAEAATTIETMWRPTQQYRTVSLKAPLQPL